MAIFYRSSYTIDPTNQNYVNAIITYNKYGHIYKLQGESCELSVSDLPLILTENVHGSDTITIETKISNSRATIGVFPHFNAEIVSKIVESDSLDAEKIKHNINQMAHFRNSHDKFNENGLCPKISNPKIDQLTMQEAFAILIKNGRA